MLIGITKKYIYPYSGHGGIFETDNSYHLIGNQKLLTTDKFIDFMSWSLLAVNKNKRNQYVNIVDIQFIGYCLLKKSACLRITKYPEKTKEPYLKTLF